MKKKNKQKKTKKQKKKQTYRGQITLSKVDEICPLTIPNQIFTISMHTPSLMKIHWHLHKLTSGNENTDGCTTDGRPDGHTDSQRDTIIPRHYRVAGYKNGVRFFVLFFNLTYLLCLLRTLNTKNPNDTIIPIPAHDAMVPYNHTGIDISSWMT